MKFQETCKLGQIMLEICFVDAIDMEIKKIQAFFPASLDSLDQPMVSEEKSEVTAPRGGEIWPTSKMKMRSQPLFDVMVLMTQQFLCVKALEDSQSMEGVEEFTNYCLQHGKPNPELLSLLEQVQLVQNKVCHIV